VTDRHSPTSTAPTAASLGHRRGELAGLAVTLAGTLVAALAAAAAGSRWVTVAALALGVVVEVLVARRAPVLLAVADQAQAGRPARNALRGLTVVLLAARTCGSSVVIVTAVAAVVGSGLAVAAVGLAALTARLRRPPVLTRNLVLDGLSAPTALRSGLVDPGGWDSLGPAVVGVAVAAAGRHHVALAVTIIGLVVVALAVSPAALFKHVVLLLRSKVYQRLPDAAASAVAALAPEVVLYFASAPAEVYQVDMWLEPVERLHRPALVVMRDPDALVRLAPTSLPVVCTPYRGVIASLPLPETVVGLFVSHSGDNVPMLRRREIRSAFVGHGDSDKADSVNPVATVYDQVWVAGPLGARRYAEAGVVLPASALVEVGRPQAGPSPSLPAVTTVLYAPTWEGWGDDPHHTKLAQVGPALVRALLAAGDIRVLYRPHPLSGQRDPALRRAHGEIVDLLHAAGARTSAQRVGVGAGKADPLDVALSVPPTSPGRAEQWNPADPATHWVLTGGFPDLGACFAAASALIGDVSSVIGDFLVMDRPYGVPDTRGMGPEAFVARFPSTAGGVVIGPQLQALDTLVEAARGGADPTAAARRRLGRDALGDPTTSSARFAAAVEALRSG
jgi:hypothetical protein